MFLIDVQCTFPLFVYALLAKYTFIMLSGVRKTYLFRVLKLQVLFMSFIQSE